MKKKIPLNDYLRVACVIEGGEKEQPFNVAKEFFRVFSKMAAPRFLKLFLKNGNRLKVKK
jgi:hypothetical protein